MKKRRRGRRAENPAPAGTNAQPPPGRADDNREIQGIFHLYTALSGRRRACRSAPAGMGQERACGRLQVFTGSKSQALQSARATGWREGEHSGTARDFRQPMGDEARRTLLRHLPPPKLRSGMDCGRARTPCVTGDDGARPGRIGSKIASRSKSFPLPAATTRSMRTCPLHQDICLKICDFAKPPARPFNRRALSVAGRVPLGRAQPGNHLRSGNRAAPRLVCEQRQGNIQKNKSGQMRIRSPRLTYERVGGSRQGLDGSRD